MKRKVINENGRDKAFIGAAIGAVGNIVGSIIGRRKQKKAAEKAYRQQQIQQTRDEGFQQAQAMSSQLANQDYVDEYRNKITLKNGGKVKKSNKYSDRIAVAKQFKCGGRKKSSFGSAVVNSFKSIGEDFNNQNLNNTITTIGSGITSAISGNGNAAPAQQGPSAATATTMSSINANKEIAQQADIRKQQRTTAARCGTKNKYACGGRKKGLFGIGAAISGIGNMIGQATQSTEPQKQVKKSAGFAYEAPKTGLTQNSYQTDANGNPVNAINTNNAANPQYQDRIQREMRCGGRKRKKDGGSILNRISNTIDKARRNDPVRHANAEYNRKHSSVNAEPYKTVKRLQTLGNLSRELKKAKSEYKRRDATIKGDRRSK